MNTTGFEMSYVDLDEWRDFPVRHRWVHGGFKGTDTRFSFYFPPKEQYQGRFFQYITPVPISETLSQGLSGEEDKIGFAISSGAYFIETNGGGSGAVGSAQPDSTVGAYRANAAVAMYSRVLAQEMYGGERPFGYAFGGSGGAYRTIGGMESTEDVWDGAVPYVVGSPMAIPNVFAVRMHAMRILKDKFPQIVDALEPGGSGDPYADLNEIERAALREVTRMGFPLKSWFGYKTMGIQAFSVLYPILVMLDSQYFTEFWTIPGYLGADSPESFHADRLQQVSHIKRVLTARDAQTLALPVEVVSENVRGTADAAWRQLEESSAGLPVAFQLADVLPDVHFLGGDLVIKSGAAAGQKLLLRRIHGDIVVIASADASVLTAIQPGDEVLVDNSNYLAAQTYHRHQVPGKEYPVWDQFRAADGKPIYPQRPMLIGPMLAGGTAGSVPSGKFTGKMILVESLWDREAYPWQADWYRARVREHFGDRTDDHFVLWYVDHALHADVTEQEDPTHTISYLGVLQQALRDLAAWVEQGIKPPASTRCEVVAGQVIVPPSAAERRGIQPIITLHANGDVQTGQPIEFIATIEVPSNTGCVVNVEWDFECEGSFPVVEQIDVSDAANVTLTRSHTFAKAGTYFPTLRAASQRQCDPNTPFARIQNLERVRVVVR